MFRELSPLLTRRNLVLTLASIGDDRLRVTITPRPTGKDDAKELAQPFAVEGTAAELDAGLSQSIVDYTTEHLTLARSLEQVKASMEAALKEAKDQAAKKIAETRKGSKQPLAKPASVEAKAEVKKPTTPSLFDARTATASFSSTIGADRPGATPEEDGGDDSDAVEGKEGQPSKQLPAAPSEAAAGTAVQPGIFKTGSEEDEILQEVFYGTQNSHIAA